MSSILKSLASPFVDLEDEEKKPAPSPAPTPSPVAVAPAPAPTPVGTLDPTMVKTITDKMLATPSAYTTFLDSAAKLESIIPDETTRFKAAIATANYAGGAVIKGIDAHLASVEQIVADFKRASDQARKSDVGSLRQQAEQKKQQAADIVRQIQEMNAQMAKLTETGQKNTVEVAELERKADAAEANINQVETNFQLAADSVVKSLTERKALLTTLLPK